MLNIIAASSDNHLNRILLLDVSRSTPIYRKKVWIKMFTMCTVIENLVKSIHL